MMPKEIFLPKFRPIDMTDPMIFEKYKNKKIYRVSHLTKCPTFGSAMKAQEEATGKIVEYSDDTRENFIQGTSVHSREEILKEGSKELIQSEKQFYIYNPDGDYLIKGTPDELKLDFHGAYLNDFKSCKSKAFFFKVKQPMSWNHKIQLSSYRYLIYVNKGIDVEIGTITFVDKEDPRHRLVNPGELNRLAEMEKFFLEHPIITGKNVDEATKEYLVAGMGFVCKLCMMNNSCKFYTPEVKTEKSKLKSKLEKRKEEAETEELDSLLDEQ